MSSRNTDCTTTYFHHMMLTKLYGEPAYDCLNRLCNRIKLNLTSVMSNLGRGNHGHLGISLTADPYHAVLNTPYI